MFSFLPLSLAYVLVTQSVSLVSQGSAVLSQQGRPQYGDPCSAETWQGERDSKAGIGSSPSPARELRDCQGQRSSEKKGSVHGAVWL